MSAEEQIDEWVRSKMTSENAGAHAYDHVKRVYHLAIRIGAEIGADLRVLKAAALMHDVGRAEEKTTGVSHSILSGEMSEEILKAVGYNSREIEMVKGAIRTHRFSENLKPKSLEGEILSDADMLDAIGAIGIYRAIAQASVTDVGIEGFLKHADEKLLKLHNMMYTEAATIIAHERHKTLSYFLSELRKELEMKGSG